MSLLIKSQMSSVSDSIVCLNRVVDKCRNILRREGITGMDSMKHLTLYTLARTITKSECELFRIPEEFAWEKFVEFAENDSKRQDCYDLLYNISGNDIRLYGPIRKKSLL